MFYFGLAYKDENIIFNDVIYEDVSFEKILMFFGLCHREYKKLRSEIELYEYIKGSHYFNKEIFKTEKKLYAYYNKYPKKIEFEYNRLIYILVDNANSDLSFVKKINSDYYISLRDLELNRTKIIGNTNLLNRIHIPDYFLKFIEKL